MFGDKYINGRRVSLIYLFAIFVLFITYGPSVSLVGQFRVLEIFLLFVFFVKISSVFNRIEKHELSFIVLFFVSSLAYVVSDLINGADFNNTLKRSTTYLILALLLPVVRYFVDDNIRVLRVMLLGYCLSSVMQYLFFSDYLANSDFNSNPWRLGIGASLTVAATLLPLFYPKSYKVMAFVLLLMAILHVLLESRSLAFITLMASVLVFIGYFRPLVPPHNLSFKTIVKFLLISSFVITLGYSFFLGLADSDLLPDDLSDKMLYQASNPYGLIAAARPETVAAIYGVSKKPFFGFGSTNIDSDVMNLYATVAAASYGLNGEAIQNNMYDSEQNSGTPNHSHLFGAWVQAGIFGALSWFFVLLMALRVLYMASQCSSSIAPLAIVVSLYTVWVIVFSPGPHRMDSAINISVLIYSTRFFDSIRHKYNISVQ